MGTCGISVGRFNLYTTYTRIIPHSIKRAPSNAITALSSAFSDQMGITIPAAISTKPKVPMKLIKVCSIVVPPTAGYLITKV